MGLVLRADNLVKKYKSRTVVNDVTLKVAQGEIVGLLGPNGAGKTTSFYMIVGLIKPLSGEIFLEKDINNYFCTFDFDSFNNFYNCKSSI